MQIRPWLPEDAPFVRGLVGRFSDGILPPWRKAAVVDSVNLQSLEASMADPAETLLVAVEGTTRLGFVHLQEHLDAFTQEPVGYLSDLAVDPAAEGQGVGRALVAAAEAWSRARGHRMLTLYVFAPNARAQALYIREGFAPEVVKYVKVLDPGSAP